MRGSLLIVVSAMSLALAGCGHKATGQTVAVVNGEEISANELNFAISQAKVPPTADRKLVTAQILQDIINRRLLAQKAQQQGIDKSPEFLNRQRSMTENLLIGIAAERQADVARLPDAKAIDGFIAGHPNLFSGRQLLQLDQLQFAQPADKGVVEKLKVAKTLDQLGAVLTSANIPFTRGKTGLDTGQLPPTVLQQINALPAGEPFIIPIQGRMFASVIVGRQPFEQKPDENRKVAAEAIRRQAADTSLQAQLKQLRGSAKIEYQSGYAPPPGTPVIPGAPATKS